MLSPNLEYHDMDTFSITTEDIARLEEKQARDREKARERNAQHPED